MEAIIRRFLNYSFKDIHFEYDGLTDEEKKLATREEFENLVKWVLRDGWTNIRG